MFSLDSVHPFLEILIKLGYHCLSVFVFLKNFLLGPPPSAVTQFFSYLKTLFPSIENPLGVAEDFLCGSMWQFLILLGIASTLLGLIFSKIKQVVSFGLLD